MQDLESARAEQESPVQDLGPLAWVLDELRKSLDGAVKAIRRFVRDAELARGSDLESLDASQLRIARQQLHQSVGALEMVGLSEPAKVLRAMETLAQRFVERPESCSEASATKVERASFALIEYLESVLRGKPASSVALFPQYRDVLELIGEDRVHPAELWAHGWRWIDVDLPVPERPLAYEPAVRVQLDSAVLRIVKTGSATAAGQLHDLCLGLAAGQPPGHARSFWKIAAACFQGLALKLTPADVYVKRAASRLLMQYTTLARGQGELSERLAQDLLFFCAQAVPPDAAQAPTLAAVRAAYGLDASPSVSYDKPQYGRFDPSVLVQARKRIATATETWSALSGGDTHRLKVVAEQFTQVGESLLKLNVDNKELVRALVKAVDATVRSGEPPSTPVAMEVATAILYVDAAYDDMDPTDTHQRERSDRLALRLDHVVAGGDPESLEPWMEELYRRVSDRQTMGSVVDELRSGLSSIEKSLDTFFRQPKDKTPLNDVPNQLAQMRGVFSVLGLDQAATATMRMRDAVEKFLVDEIDESAARAGVFDKFGNSLGALGFLIDMLSYQRLLAKKLFVYDEELGELRSLVERERQALPPASQAMPLQAEPVELAAAPAAAPATGTAATPATAVDEDDDADLGQIFLEEAREVVVNGRNAVGALHAAPGDLGEQTTLRRSFHTLKGSSRMVGLTEFGEAAWAMEQLMNSWLAEQKPAPAELLDVADEGLLGLGRWVEAIAQGEAAHFSAQPFRASADAMRNESRRVPLILPLADPSGPTEVLVGTYAPGVEPAPPAFDFPSLPDLALEPAGATPPVTEPAPDAPEAPVIATPAPAAGGRAGEDFLPTEVFDFKLDGLDMPELQAAPAASVELAPGDVGDIDFSSLAGVPAAAPAPELSLDSPGSGPEVPVSTEASTAFSDVAFEWDLPVDADPSATGGAAQADDALEARSIATTDAPLELSLEFPPDDAPVHDDVDTEISELAGMDGLDAPGEISPLSLSAEPPAPSEEQVKVIGDLRIGIPLYNVYLNEADEWSRRLSTEVNEWALELHEPVPDTAVALAHSLAGSSATVGFLALSGIARSLEHAMQHVQLHGQKRPQDAAVFVAAADNIRQLLHQFAAGFLKAPEPGLSDALQGIIDTAFDSAGPTTASAPRDVEGDPSVFDFDSLTDFGDSSAPTLVPDDLPTVTSSPWATTPSAVTVPGTLNSIPGAARIVDLGDDDEDIDAVDAIDPDLFPIFDEEAAELMPHLGAALRAWAAEPAHAAARLDVLRALHTLKGSARLAGAMRLGEMAHRMESAIEQMGTDFVQASQIEPMLGRYDRLAATLDALRRTPEAPEAEAGMPAMDFGSPADGLTLQDAAANEPLLPDLPVAPELRAVAPPPRVVMPEAALRPAAVTPARSGNTTVRVRSSLLDRLVNQAGEVMITRSRLDARLGQLNGSLGELTVNLDRLRAHLRDVELQAESQMQSRLAQAKDSAQGFDPLEFDRFTRVQELTRMMAESVNDVATVQRTLQQTIRGTEDDLIAQARQTRELQRDLLRTRMVEFEGISERLYGVVRQAAKDAGKQVRLDIVGGTMEVDRGVLERMTPAFEHLLRNAVGHGIEAPAAREAEGKPAVGTIQIAVAQEGNDVSITFTDDGEGLNLARIREKAQAQGLVEPGRVLGDDEAAGLIFLPGFSTAARVTELSGRGIGMDVVRSEIQSLGGRIETATAPGAGTRFKLVLPLTTAVTQVIMLRMGDLSIGVPANLVEIVRRLKADELEQAYQHGGIVYDNQTLPFFWAGALLQSSSRSHEHGVKSHAVVILRSAGQRLAVHVDEVLGSQEVVVKNLGPQLARLPGLAGMSVLASGAVVLIYNPVALAAVYGDRAHDMQRHGQAMGLRGEAPGLSDPAEIVTASAPLSGDELPLVLVVDDSITVRRVTQRLLRREGYRVALAADGLQALEQLTIEKPAVVLSDIEMPRMDGFDLLRNIRADVHLKDLPVIMITSRIAQKHRDLAEQLGANHYLGKPYSEDDLLALVKHYSEQASASA